MNPAPMSNPAKISDLEGIFSNIVSIVLGFAGIALFFMLIIGGFKYITSGGDPQKAEGAKNTLSYGVYGLVLLLLSFLILSVIEKITGAKVTEFIITR